MRVAVIDLGTNTFNLLVADVHQSDFTIVHNSKEGVALGMGGINERNIDEAATERAFHAFEKFKEICDSFGVEKIVGIATSAVRDAVNGEAFVKMLYDKFQISIEIIDGLREAELIYKGVSWSYDFPKTSLIMDIGGGSTEFIRVEKGKELQAASLNIGVSRAYQLFEFSDPLSQTDRKELENWFETQASELSDFKACPILVGASGSFETFYEMTHLVPFPQGTTPIQLTRKELLATIDTILNSTLEERENNPFILPIRRKMAPIAALKTKWIIEKFGIEEIYISPCSLKEGVLRAFCK